MVLLLHMAASERLHGRWSRTACLTDRDSAYGVAKTGPTPMPGSRRPSFIGIEPGTVHL